MTGWVRTGTMQMDFGDVVRTMERDLPTGRYPEELVWADPVEEG